MRDNTGHTLVFTVDDVALSRVELIIRRCNGVRAPASCCLDASTCSVHLLCRLVETTVDVRSKNSTGISHRIISIRQMHWKRSAAMRSVYAGPRPRPHRSSLVTNETEARREINDFLLDSSRRLFTSTAATANEKSTESQLRIRLIIVSIIVAAFIILASVAAVLCRISRARGNPSRRSRSSTLEHSRQTKTCVRQNRPYRSR